MNTAKTNIESDLERFLFKQPLTPDEVKEITTIAEYRQFEPGQTILAEGATNDRLFFLIEGSISVVRSGETIASLSSAGGIIGEMSLITGKPCSASNFAQTKTTLLDLEVEKVRVLPHEIQSSFFKSLYRLFSLNLANKLELTNEKARMFEITNRELQAAKKAQEEASADKIDELSHNQRLVFRRLHTVLNKEIVPLRDQLTKLSSGTAASSSEIATLSTKMQQVYNELEPLSRVLASEGSLHDKRVLLVEDDINEQINAKMSLGGTGVDFTVLPDLESAKNVLKNQRFDIICVNSSAVDLIAYSRSLYPDVKYVFITSDPISEHFQTLKKYPELSTILARHPKDRTFTVKNISTTIRKLSSQDIFGMEKYLNWGTEVSEFTVTRSDQRAEMIEKLEAYIDSIGIRGGLKRKASRVAEELLMNAIYDAPTDASGKSIYNHLDRSQVLVLKPEEYATFRFACDGTLLAVSVVDSYGALTRSTILNYLERCFKEQTGEAVDDKGGGGNGLFQIIQSSSLTAFNVKPHKRTEVIALLNINIQIEKVSLHPSFHYFEN